MATSSLVNLQNSAAMFVVNTDEQRPGAEELRLASRLASLVRTTNINMADTDKAVKIDEGDPQSVQDLTGFVPFDIQNVTVQTLLQQMQDKFQNMSDQIITRNILLLLFAFTSVVHFKHPYVLILDQSYLMI
ncbi:Heat shock factor-binding protein 1 [Desmophyllum pertusum]|uniref:Heat shock factor-binding protein 1 n=1 Tax=Desmophyllum pertusum TaxID=174260 RepID=A0A9W9YPF4_9CNID|nr:Heat shock factor-binding protein 1 [Desmophyllum pertusum]